MTNLTEIMKGTNKHVLKLRSCLFKQDGPKRYLSFRLVNLQKSTPLKQKLQCLEHNKGNNLNVSTNDSLFVWLCQQRVAIETILGIRFGLYILAFA